MTRKNDRRLPTLLAEDFLFRFTLLSCTYVSSVLHLSAEHHASEPPPSADHDFCAEVRFGTKWINGRILSRTVIGIVDCGPVAMFTVFKYVLRSFEVCTLRASM